MSSGLTYIHLEQSVLSMAIKFRLNSCLHKEYILSNDLNFT